MQRRWAAVCLAFFLVTAGGAYGAKAVAEKPSLDLEGDTYQNNDTFERNGTTYTVQVSDGSGELVYNQTVSKEETLNNGSVVEYSGGQYNVTIDSGANPSGFTLVEEFNVQAILQNDSAVENQTYTAEDGTRFVRYRNGTTQPLDEYLPDPERAEFSEGGTIRQANQTKTISNVTNQTVTLTYETTEQQTKALTQGANVTIDNRLYVPVFPSSDEVKLTRDVIEYQRQVSHQEYYKDRLSGLNYVIIFSLASAFILVTTAFMPRRG